MSTQQSSSNGDMSLQQHLDLLGIDAKHLGFQAKLEETVVRRALAGEPISAPHAQQICNILNREHKLVGKIGFKPEDLQIKVYVPHERHHQPAFDPNKR